MKQPKRLTREQKCILRNTGLDCKNWMLVSESDFYLKIINKKSGRIREISRFPPAKRKVPSASKQR